MRQLHHAAAEGKKEALAELIKAHEAGIARIAAECKTEIGALKSSWRKSGLAWVGSGIVGNIGFSLLLFILWIACKAWVIDMVGSIYRTVNGT
ncbi:MAG: hypothetical protein K2O70_07755 [Desulfovibrionaceae bacterium]|nr:hypothetical protein [Desulfovibrionaceae bacterium]